MNAEITAGLAAANHAFTVAKALISTAKGIADLNTKTEINMAISEIQLNLLEIQQQLSDAQRRYDELAALKRKAEEALAAYENWKVEKDLYRLAQIEDNVFVYMLKKETDPRPRFCANYFGNRVISILQRERPGFHVFVCHACESEIEAAPSKAMEHARAKEALGGE